jgi:hypothetical protein
MPTSRSGHRRARVALALVAGGLAAITATSSRADAYRPPEFGYGYGEIEGPRTLAMGGAARAYGWSTSAIDSNPANVSAQRVYHAELLGGLDTKAHRLQYGATVIDGITSKLAMGLQAVRTTQGNTDDVYQRTSTDIRLNGSYPLGDRFFLGVTGRWLRTAQDGLGPLGPSAVSKSGGDANATVYTFDAGFLLALSESLRIGVVGYNLTAPKGGIAPLMVGGALGFRAGEFTIEADTVATDPTYWGTWKMRYQGGAEYLVADRYPIRAGYVYDAGAKRSSLSGGLGYVEKQFAFDFGVRGDLSSPDVAGKALVFVVGLRYFVESGAGDQSGPAAPAPY